MVFSCTDLLIFVYTEIHSKQNRSFFLVTLWRIDFLIWNKWKTHTVSTSYRGFSLWKSKLWKPGNPSLSSRARIFIALHSCCVSYRGLNYYAKIYSVIPFCYLVPWKDFTHLVWDHLLVNIALLQHCIASAGSPGAGAVQAEPADSGRERCNKQATALWLWADVGAARPSSGKGWRCLHFHWGPHWILQPTGQEFIYSCHCHLVTVSVHSALLQWLCNQHGRRKPGVASCFKWQKFPKPEIVQLWSYKAFLWKTVIFL